MKYCQYCGGEMHDQAVVCVKCGCPVQNAKPIATEDSVSVGLVILSVLIPLFGIIYWPVKAKECPKRARACGIAGIVAWVVFFLLLV